MAYSRDAFITEIRDRLERDQRGIREGLERDQRETRERQQRFQQEKKDGAIAYGLSQTNKRGRESQRGDMELFRHIVHKLTDRWMDRAIP